MSGLARALLLSSSLLASCSTAPAPVERTGTARAAIIGGEASPPAQDAVVLLMSYDATSVEGAAGCTGTMLTPRLVLTARHCVADTDDTVACDATGNPVEAGAVRGDHAASTIYAFGGAARPNFLSGLDRAAQGLELIDDDAKTLCNHDLALVLLDRDLQGTLLAPVRLDRPAEVGEVVTVVGFGLTEKDTRAEARLQRAGVRVEAVGPGGGLGDAELRLGESSCQGDSGGPALAASGAVLGVVSRGGNGSGKSGAAGCVSGANVFTSVWAYRDLIRAAYARAGQAPWLEGEPDPRTVAPPTAPAPAAAADDGGCTAAPRGARGPAAPWSLALALLVLACRRRRRSAMLAA